MPTEVRGSVLSGESPGTGEEEAVREGIAGSFDRLKPGPGLPPQAVASHQRMRIQRAMAHLVAAGGRRVVTIRKLTKLAGVSTETFYSHFENADECLLSTYDTLMAEFRSRIASTRIPSAGRRRQSELAIQALLDALVADSDAGRLALIEVIEAGPAAFAPMRTHETLLEASLREFLDRRGIRIAPPTVAWVVAGLLHSARHLLDARLSAAPPDETGALLSWGRRCLVEQVAGDPGLPARRESLRAKDFGEASVPTHADETDLILNAVLKVAREKGYWELSVRGASKVAGVPATHFKRRFKKLDDAYLLAVERAARRLFASFGSKPKDRDWQRALHDWIASLSVALASDPDTAKVVFVWIIAPGVAGLTRRQALIDELAMAWVATVPAESRPPDCVAKASMASLWAALARSAETERTSELPAQAATYARLFLASMPRARRAREMALAGSDVGGSSD
jgi:AcrR family transcriptional regulator